MAWRRAGWRCYLSWEAADEPELREHLPDIPVISHLEVDPRWRRHGIGSALLNAAEASAFAHGHGFVCLGVGFTDPAWVLYERRGYDDWGHGVVPFTWEQPGPDGVPVAQRETCRVLLKSVDPSIPGLDRWAAWHPTDAAALLARCPVPWCVAAGWAIDLHVGRQTRDHSDLEIAIPRVAVWRPTSLPRRV